MDAVCPLGIIGGVFGAASCSSKLSLRKAVPAMNEGL